MNEQLLKMSGADVLSFRKKLRKTLWGWIRLIKGMAYQVFTIYNSIHSTSPRVGRKQIV